MDFAMVQLSAVMKVHDGGALKDIVKGILTELVMVMRLALAKAR